MVAASGISIVALSGSVAQSASFPVLSYQVDAIAPVKTGGTNASQLASAPAAALPAPAYSGPANTGSTNSGVAGPGATRSGSPSLSAFTPSIDPRDAARSTSDRAAASPPSATPAAVDADKIAAVDPAALECMAKVVHHEARNQPRAGQIAVAQTLLNRIKAGRFGETVCQVANQRGQFFDTAAYRPSQDSDTWANAIDVARAVLRGDAEVSGVAHGAMFFRAASHRANGFFRGRERVGAIGDHIFYR